MTYAVAEGARNGVTMKMGEAARDKFRAAAAAGSGDQDFSAIAELDRPAGDVGH
jgi:3-hydroxyisobutyrate dehydrogenase-like beta-hydroxyacid dehydrogenase